MGNNQDRRKLQVHQLRANNSPQVVAGLRLLTLSQGYPYLKDLMEAVADQHGGDLPQNDEDRERIYEAAIIRKAFKKVTNLIENLPNIVDDAAGPEDLLAKITEAQSSDLQKVVENG
jgi:hypothetical protein